MTERFTPEYIALCREAKLEREMWLAGDWKIWSGTYHEGQEPILTTNDSYLEPEWVWLPLEGDLLDLLGDFDAITIFHKGGEVPWRADFDETHSAYGQSRLEALLSLYLTVKG